MLLAFFIWCACFGIFLILGITCFFAKKAVGFWANAKAFPLENVKGYNRACGWLWIGYSLVGMLSGLPLLAGQNHPLVLLSVLAVVLDTLALMLIYVLVIEKKFRAKK